MLPPPIPPKREAVLADKLRTLHKVGDFVAIPRGQYAKSRRTAIHTTARRLEMVVTVRPCPEGVILDHERYFGVWRIE